MTEIAASTPAIRPGPNRPGVSRRVEQAIVEVVWRAADRSTAAAAAGLTDDALYRAMRRPAVQRFYLAELAALRLSSQAVATHTLISILKTSENDGARVAAARELRQASAGEDVTAPSRPMPGLIIQINGAAKVEPKLIEHDAELEADEDQGDDGEGEEEGA